MIYNTSELIIELADILKANKLLHSVVTNSREVPIAEATKKAEAFIRFIKAIPSIERNSTEIDGYDWRGLFSIVVSVDCSGDEYLLNNIMDSISRSILIDEVIWTKLVDRDIISIEYDDLEFAPKREATLIMQARYRLTCN